MVRKLRIMDWLVHGGHQYEFFKTGHNFYCTNFNGSAPNFADLNRLKNKNVNYIREKNVIRQIKEKVYFDIIMVRAGLNPKRYEPFRLGKGRQTPGIAVIQTHTPHKVPGWVKYCVWNSKVSMDMYRKTMPKKKHFYIPHGFDPLEFKFLNLKRDGKVLSAVSLFEKRGKILGFDNWKWVSDQLGGCLLLGHGNHKLEESIGNYGFYKLVNRYNRSSVYLNTTIHSAMPRSRAEALMCGTPLVTTNNYGIDKYLVNNKSCIFADTKEDMLKAINKILDSKQMQIDLSSAGREAAIKYFNIKDYLSKWEQVFEEVMRR
jgi:glycosyltransferase involved in cell wall biosynthesis